ncbi:MAG: hypothetical protein AVDCRST_MAG78-3031 [uncultured Rubrobacteraceae bacterium]|uniref:Uncharacterized protein n=1 Tax=uncultured Rubrobacteraceae bacterium TaxID=349277 RepID=A0A6J4QRS5_9ACTN|nr:MAG: hypothetical protein AVDCRST_MAG78-3031 [uncultured Rubrobacteraceae bacterium]
MDPGEQITGTRDEHYNLVSVLYHALHAAETMEAYILDAEAVGDERLTSFFSEAQATQRQLAERAKGMLGILEVPPEPEIAPDLPPEGGISPGEISGGIPPEGVDSPEGEEAILGSTGTEGATVPPSGAIPPGEIPPERSTGEVPSGPDEYAAPPDADVVPPEDVAPSGGAVSDVPAEITTERIVPEDFDPTISALRDGVENLAIGRALSEIDGWEQKLEESGDPQLAPIAENLRQLKALLTADRLDSGAIGVLLGVLGEQVQDVASGSLGESVGGKLRQLGGLLDTEGRAVTNRE